MTHLSRLFNNCFRFSHICYVSNTYIHMAVLNAVKTRQICRCTTLAYLYTINSPLENSMEVKYDKGLHEMKPLTVLILCTSPERRISQGF